MNNDKQNISQVLKDYTKKNNIMASSVILEDYAEALYNAGCRKASDVAREIFEEIEKSFIEYYDKTITYSSPTLPIHIREAASFALNEMFMKVAELKKKYAESEKK